MATKRPRLSADETRLRLCSAGVVALCTSGMSVGLDAVNLEQAVRDANVSRSSAYAAWANDDYSPQEYFQRSVLMHAIETRKDQVKQLTVQAMEIYSGLDGTMSKHETFRELIRLTAEANMAATSNSTGWKLVVAVGAALHSNPEEERDSALALWLDERATLLSDYIIENMYKPLAQEFGLVPRPQYGERAFKLGEICLAAASDGLSMRYWLDSRKYLDNLPHPTVESDDKWSMYSLVFEQVVQMFFVPESGSWDDF